MGLLFYSINILHKTKSKEENIISRKVYYLGGVEIFGWFEKKACEAICL